MTGSINKVILVGCVGKHGCTLTYAPSGAACARFFLVCTEEPQPGKYFSTAIPCEIWGKRAEKLSTELEPGQCVLFEGKVVRRKKNEQWEMAISGFDCTPIALPAEVTP